MKIGINALYLIPGKVGGSEIYLRHLISALGHLDQENEYVVFTNRESRGSFELGENFREHHCPVRALIRPHRIVWEQLVLPYRARQHRLDLLHSPGSTAPLFLSCPSVLTILDLIYLHFPETFPALARIWIKFLVYQSARRSSAVIALSRYSRDEILWDLNTAWDKVRVIYMAISAAEASSLPRRERIKTLRKYGIVFPFILTVAAAHPHKNLVRLLEAFYQLKKKGGKYQLIVVGVKHNRYFQRLRREISSLDLEEDVIFTDWVPEADKEMIYAEARLMVFPSLLEGFGLPVLEAMAAGLPVACSDVPSLEEVAGDAAYIFNPYSVEEIRRAMEECLSRPELREELVRRGYEQAKKFDWNKTARETLDLYREVYEKNRRKK